MQSNELVSSRKLNKAVCSAYSRKKTGAAIPSPTIEMLMNFSQLAAALGPGAPFASVVPAS
jgi:hypothetical protein